MSSEVNGQIQFDSIDFDVEQPTYTGTAWRGGRVPPRSMKINGPLGELGVRQRVVVQPYTLNTPRKQPYIVAAELSNSESSYRQNSAPLRNSSESRRKKRHQEGPSMQNLKNLDRLMDENNFRKEKLDAERGAPLTIETLQEWDSEHRHNKAEIDKLQKDHAMIQTKILAQTEGINQLIGQRALDKESYTIEMEALKAKQEAELVALYVQHATDLGLLMESHKEQLGAERAKREEAVAACHQKYKQLEFDLTNEYEKRITDITARYEERIASSARFHERRADKQVDSLQKKVSQLHQHQEAEHLIFNMDEKDVLIASKLQIQMEKMQKDHQYELENLRQEKATELAALEVRMQYEEKLGKEIAARHSSESVTLNEALEKKVKSLTEEVTRWRNCAEEASNATTNLRLELEVTGKRYDELKTQLMESTRDEVAAATKEATDAALTWERRFLELQVQYDQLNLKSTLRTKDHEQQSEEAARWEKDFIKMQNQYRFEKSKCEAEIEALRDENSLLRKRISYMDTHTCSTAASTPLPDNGYRSLISTPQPPSMPETPQSRSMPGRSSSTTPGPFLDRSTSTPLPIPEEGKSQQIPEDLMGLSWGDMQKAMGNLSTEDLLRMTGRQQ